MSARDTLKLLIGQVAEIALPGLRREIDDFRNPNRAAKLKKAIIYARLRRAHARGDASAMDDAAAAFWKGRDGARFHENYIETRFGSFLEQNAVAVDALANHISVTGLPLTRLVEVGCGDGQVLAESLRRLPTVTQAIGLDINAPVIERAAAHFKQDARLSFLNGDARAWLEANPQPGTIMLSHGGVLEYFAPDSVERLYQALTRSRPSAVVLVEPAAPEHDMDRQGDSYAFGYEYSFSHNHRHRLTAAGFRIVFEEEKHQFGARMLLTTAVLA